MKVDAPLLDEHVFFFLQNRITTPPKGLGDTFSTADELPG